MWIGDVYHTLKVSVTWTDVVLYGALLLITWYIYKITVAPFLSPLRKIPGCPYRPWVGNMVEARKSEAMTNCLRWMKEFNSKIIRFYFYGGEERLLVADPDIFRQVLVTNSKNYVRHQQAIRLTQLIGSPPLFSISGEAHHVIRKIANPAFSPNALYGMLPVFEERSRKLVQIWSDMIHFNHQEKHVDIEIQFYLMRLTIDVICQVGFDYKINSLEKPGSSGEDNLKSVISFARPGLLDFLPFSDLIPTKTNKQFWHDAAFAKEFTAKLIEHRLQRSKDEGSKHKDILSMLIDARNEEGAGLTDEQLIGQVFGFLVAGFETTNTAMTWILLKLAENQDIQDKVREEIMSTLEKSEKGITHEHLDKMKYLSCVIKETFRLLPPITCLFKRAEADDNFKGYHIPKGTVIGLHIGALQRLNWENGDQFQPDRFLDLEGVEGKLYVPFGFGPYMCIGNKFSMLEMKTVLSLLLRNFRFDTVPGRGYRRVQGVTMRPEPPAILRVSHVCRCD